MLTSLRSEVRKLCFDFCCVLCRQNYLACVRERHELNVELTVDRVLRLCMFTKRLSGLTEVYLTL